MDNVTKNSTEQLQGLLIRMERNNNIVRQLSKKINAYTSEPTNPSRFEKLHELRRGFMFFNAQQKHIMGLIEQRRVSSIKLKEDIKLHLNQFKKLEKDIAAYLLDVNQYS
ncbi:hypothetical protein [Flagellimonas pacifica]|nr:hypothetical protein [Allomuricauda parva]